MEKDKDDTPQIRAGIQISTLRKQLKITQAVLASKAGMEESALQRIEAGRTNPTIKTLFKVAGALEVHIKVLFEKM